MNTILVTGGAGFMGSNFVLNWLARENGRVINLDSLTYAGNLDTLQDILEHPLHNFVHGNICDTKLVANCLYEEQPDAIVHFAAESHVDRSIDGPAPFIQTNIIGTFTLLEAARKYLGSVSSEKAARFRFIHISTDEVYGSLGVEGLFDENSPLSPNSPYAASKASSDLLVRSYFQTYGIPVITTNCSNNYGKYQFPEKLIPMIILNAREGKPFPVYGDGENIRDWLYVEDHSEAIRCVLERGVVGETYNIGGNNEKTNLEVVHSICDLLDNMLPKSVHVPFSSLITFVEDRPGHDRRYGMDTRKILQVLDWRPKETFQSGLEKTVHWYLQNIEWCNRVTSGAYRRERLGLAAI